VLQASVETLLQFTYGTHMTGNAVYRPTDTVEQAANESEAIFWPSVETVWLFSKPSRTLRHLNIFTFNRRSLGFWILLQKFRENRLVRWRANNGMVIGSRH